MATPLSAPCLGRHGLSHSGAVAAALAAPASAPGQLQVEHAHRSPPSVGSPACPAVAPALPAGEAQARHQSNFDGSARMLEQPPARQKGAAPPPPSASGQVRRAEAAAAPRWRCARCRQPLPADAESCKCDVAPPPKRLNTGSSGRVHSRVEALDEGQMEKLLDLAQELGLLPVSSSGSAGQPSWIPRLAGSPSPRPSLQPGAAQSTAPGQREGPAWPSGSMAQRQPVWPQAWPQAAEKQLCRAAANLQALLSQQEQSGEHVQTAEPRLRQQQQPHHMLLPLSLHDQQSPRRQPQQQPQQQEQPQQQPQQHHHHRQRHHPHLQRMPRPQQPQQQPQRMSHEQQQQQRAQQRGQQQHRQHQHMQWEESPQTPVERLLPPPKDPPALTGLPGAVPPQPPQRPPPPLVLRSFESLPVPLPPQPQMLQRCPSEPLPMDHQHAQPRPHQPQPQQQVELESERQPRPKQRMAAQSPQQQQKPKQQQQQQQQQQQDKQQKEKKKQKRQQPAEGSPSLRDPAGQEAGTARELAAAMLGKVWQKFLDQQAADVAAWQKEQRQLLMEAHEEQSKQLRLAHQVQLLQLERAHLLGMARQGSDPLPTSPPAAQPGLPLGPQPRHAQPAAQHHGQQQPQHGQPGAQQQRWGEIASFLLRVQSRHGRQ